MPAIKTSLAMEICLLMMLFQVHVSLQENAVVTQLKEMNVPPKADTVYTNDKFCYCNLDAYLKDIREKKHKGQSVPKYQIPTTTPAPAPTMAAGAVGADGVDESSTNKCQDDGILCVQAEDDECGANTVPVVNCNTGQVCCPLRCGMKCSVDGITIAATSVKRRKRAAVVAEPLLPLRTHKYGVIHPTKGVVFDTSTKLSDDVGVRFLTSYKPSRVNCSCKAYYNVTVSFCLLNKYLDTSSGLASDAEFKTIAGTALLEWMDELLMEELPSGLYIRTLLEAIKQEETHITVHFLVQLRDDYLSHYYVKSAVEPKFAIDQKAVAITGYKFIVDKTVEDCLIIEDITIPVVVPPHHLSWMIWILLPVGIAILVLLCLLTCCGSGDKFYMRFW